MRTGWVIAMMLLVLAITISAPAEVWKVEGVLEIDANTTTSEQVKCKGDFEIHAIILDLTDCDSTGTLKIYNYNSATPASMGAQLYEQGSLVAQTVNVITSSSDGSLPAAYNAITDADMPDIPVCGYWWVEFTATPQVAAYDVDYVILGKNH